MMLPSSHVLKGFMVNAGEILTNYTEAELSSEAVKHMRLCFICVTHYPCDRIFAFCNGALHVLCVV